MVSTADPTVTSATIEDGGAFELGVVIGGKDEGKFPAGEYRVRVTPPKDETVSRTGGMLDPRYESFDSPA